MSYYRKIISYIDLYEEEEKKQNIGFVKVQIKEEKCQVQICVKGLPCTDSFLCKIKSADGKIEIDDFLLQGGQGNYKKSFPVDRVGKEKAAFEQIRGILLPLSVSRYGKTCWEEPEGVPIRQEELEKIEEKPGLGKIIKESNVKEQEVEQTEEREIKTSEVEEQEAEILNMTEQEEIKATEIEPTVLEEVQLQPVKTKVSNKPLSDREEREDRICTDKWRQLCQMYQVVHPFEEEQTGEYLSVTPKDFVILQGQYQKLVNNSFLLHGYYNYRHLILAKRITANGTKYYVGVPGCYYEREKMVAVMFGFEAFEPAKENGNTDQIAQGTYGYYLYQVQI